jgi:tetratricopeptide (TPR) repeat protein
VLTETGKDESPEADAIRDRLERPWHDLSVLEKKRIVGLSEDLYSLNDPVEERLPMSTEAHQGLSDAIAASRAGDSDNALTLLRRWAKYLDPAKLSFERGCVWEEAGDSETATPFFEHAVKLDPGNDASVVMYLSALNKSEPGAALSRSRKIVEQAELQQPLVVARAAEILTKSTLCMTDTDARPVLRQLMHALKNALDKLTSLGQKEDSLTIPTHTSITKSLGFCYFRLGDHQAAIDSYSLGLSRDPADDSLLIIRGTLRYGADPLAIDDFEQAIRRGSNRVWPYFFLAHHHLVGNRFGECKRMCERALELPASDDVRANLTEWLAISEAELRFPRERVRSRFEAAIRLAPDFEHIKLNLEKFESSTAVKQSRPLPWVEPTQSTIQQFGESDYSLIGAWPDEAFRSLTRLDAEFSRA